MPSKPREGISGLKYHSCPSLRGTDNANERNLLDYSPGLFDSSALSGIFPSYKTAESVLLTFLTYFKSSPPTSPLLNLAINYVLNGIAASSPEFYEMYTQYRNQSHLFETQMWLSRFCLNFLLSSQWNWNSFACYPRHLILSPLHLFRLVSESHSQLEVPSFWTSSSSLSMFLFHGPLNICTCCFLSEKLPSSTLVPIASILSSFISHLRFNAAGECSILGLVSSRFFIVSAY